MSDDLKACLRERAYLWSARMDLTEDERIEELERFCKARGIEAWELTGL